MGHAISWDESKIEGDLAGREGLVRFVKGGRLLAVATGERDVAALEEALAPGRSSAIRATLTIIRGNERILSALRFRSMEQSPLDSCLYKQTSTIFALSVLF